MAARRAPAIGDLFGETAPAPREVGAARARQVAPTRKAAAAMAALAPVAAPVVSVEEIVDPVDRAWAQVAAECPTRASPVAHRHGDRPLVHVIPMGHPADIYCEHGEEVPGYPGFYRPEGGHRHRRPKSVRALTDEEERDGVKLSKPLPSMKTHAYKMAEMAGRARTS